MWGRSRHLDCSLGRSPGQEGMWGRSPHRSCKGRSPEGDKGMGRSPEEVEGEGEVGEGQGEAEGEVVAAHLAAASPAPAAATALAAQPPQHEVSAPGDDGILVPMGQRGAYPRKSTWASTHPHAVCRM